MVAFSVFRGGVILSLPCDIRARLKTGLRPIEDIAWLSQGVGVTAKQKIEAKIYLLVPGPDGLTVVAGEVVRGVPGVVRGVPGAAVVVAGPPLVEVLS